MKLYRARKDRFIGGVCGGLGHYFKIDSNLVRLLFALSLLIGGIGLVMYIAALLLIPQAMDEEEVPATSSVDSNMFWGILLVAVGAVLLLRQMDFFDLFDVFDMPLSTIWALTLIGVGVFLLYNHWQGDRQEATALTVEEKDTADSQKPGFSDIHRSRFDRKIAGVCGGIAGFLKVDSNLIRLGWVLLTLLSFGLGIILYLVALLVFPEEPMAETTA